MGNERNANRHPESRPGDGAPGKPNILLIITDQEHPPRWFGDDREKIDERLPARAFLRRWGIEFTDAHYNTLPCSPSRASIFTGLYSHQHHIYGNCGMDGSYLQDFPTIGTILRDDHGYQTYYIGKSHLASMQSYDCDENRKNGMRDYGFDEWVTAENASPLPPGAWPDRICYDSVGYMGEGSMEDRAFAQATVEFLERDEIQQPGRRPWFAAVGLVNPHDIMWYPRFTLETDADPVGEMAGNYEDREAIEKYKPTCHEEYVTLYEVLGGTMAYPPDDDPDSPLRRKWQEFVETYFKLIERNDRALAEILVAVLKLPKLVRNNVVLAFTADHGDSLGAHGMRAKGPNMYEEQANVPLIFVDFSSVSVSEEMDLTLRPPQGARGGRYIREPGAKRHALVSHLDLATTLITLGADNADQPESWRERHRQVQGANLLPLLGECDAESPVMAPDPKALGAPVSDTQRDHTLATCDQSFSLPVPGDHGNPVAVTTAPHIVSLRQRKRDEQGRVISDYKLNLYYNWRKDEEGLVVPEPGAHRAKVDWKDPKQAELYDLSETEPALVELGNLIPPDLPQADRRGEVDGRRLAWPPKFELENGKRVSRPFTREEREKHRLIYEEMREKLISDCVPEEIRRRLPVRHRDAHKDAWKIYREGRNRGEFDSLDLGDRIIEAVGL